MDRAAERGPGIVLWGWVVLMGLLLLTPVFVVVPLSFTGESTFRFPPREWSIEPYLNVFTDRRWWSSILNSFTVAIATTVVSTVLGVLAALGIRRLSARASGVMQALFLAPLVVPAIVTGVAVYGAYLRVGLSGTVAGFVVAHTVLALPFVVLVVSAQLGGLDRGYEAAAASLGAGPLTAFFTVTLRLIAPSVLTGALFAFVTSFDESVVALFLQSPTVSTLPVTMFSAVTQRLDVTIASAASLVIATSIVVVVALLFSGGGRRKKEEAKR